MGYRRAHELVNFHIEVAKKVHNDDSTCDVHAAINSGVEQVSGSIARSYSIYIVRRRKPINIAAFKFSS